MQFRKYQRRYLEQTLENLFKRRALQNIKIKAYEVAENERKLLLAEEFWSTYIQPRINERLKQLTINSIKRKV